MKKTVQYIALAAFTLSLAACQQDNALQEINDPNAVKINATIGALQSRVTYGDNGATSFSDGDAIKVQNTKRTSKNEATYTYNGTTWSIQEGSLVWNSGENTNQFNAWYPATASYDSFELPEDQSDASKLAAADWMTATTVDMSKPSNCKLNLSFAHKLAKVTVNIEEYGSQFSSTPTLDEVKIYTHDGTKTIIPMAGTNSYTAIVTPGQYNGSNNFMTFKVENEAFTVKPTTTLTGGLEAGKHYTFTLTVGKDKATIGKVSVADWGTSQEIPGGEAKEIPYVTFKAVSEQTLDLVQTESQKLDEWGNSVYEDDEETIPVYVPNPYPWDGVDTGYIEYSVGNSNEWKTFTPESDPVAFGGDMGDLHLRGISPKGTLQAQIVFEKNNNTPVACSGDIRTLVDWENYENAVTDSTIFRGLFENCTVLKSAPELPATTLAPYCYYRMFEECTSLETAPALPATTLAAYCYKSMFNGCTGLINAPVLPAPTLANECYGMMFHGCAKLTAAPELPATNLAADCYNGMFAGCSELTSAPALPATTLADNCYISMFARCSKLTSAPALPATTLTSSCYYDMFNGCTSLNSVTMLAEDIPENGDCLTNWLSGVATTGTFTKATGMESLPTGVSGIPEGWDVKNYGEPEN